MTIGNEYAIIANIHIENKAKEITMEKQMIVALLKMIFALIGIIVVANIFLRFINRKIERNRGTIGVVDKVQVANGSWIAIVEALGSHYLMSISEHGNSLLKELTRNEIELITQRLLEEKEYEHASIKEKINIRKMAKKRRKKKED